MKIEISGRNYEVSEKIRKTIETKLDKVRKYFTDIIEIRCVLKVEKYRNICEIKIHGAELDIAARQEGETMDEAVEMTIDHLKRQAQKNRTKVKDQRKGRTTDTTAPSDWQVFVLERGHLRQDDSKPRIVKTTQFPIKLMSIEQAALVLDDSKNAFIVFRDFDTDRVAVLYRRKDNNFGMIAPEF